MLCCLLGAFAASLSGAATAVLGGVWKWLAGGATCVLLAGAVYFLAADLGSSAAYSEPPLCTGARSVTVAVQG